VKQARSELVSSSTYDAFAPFYDAFTEGSDYDGWTTHVLEVVRRFGGRGRTLLDVACGTGKSFAPFVERGFEVTGVDLSEGMLAIAARRSPAVSLVEADMRALPELGSFDLVTCFDDSLNYLLEEWDLADALRSMATNLAPTGLAVFDLNTLFAYRTTFACDSVTARDGTIFAWRGESSPDVRAGCRTAARIDVFLRDVDALYERISTRHEQRHFPRNAVLTALRTAGLECVGVFGVLDDGALAVDADELSRLKVLYLARHAKGGDVE
jgi:SAM-dependent methyltransferase